MSLNLVIAQVLLLTLGLLGVATADSGSVPEHAGKIIMALVVTFGLSRLRPKAFLRLATPFWVVTLALLVLVLFIGVGGNGSPVKRWLPLGAVSFQPSEFAKIGLILQLASFFARRGVQRKLISAVGMIMVTTMLILLEPDLGTTVLTFSLGLVLMYAAGVKFTSITGFLLALMLLALPFASVYLEKHTYILDRIRGHAEARGGDTQNAGYQLFAAHRDLSSGGFWGQGPDAPRYEYSADATDMVVASVGFSTGLLGVGMVIFAYWLVVASGLQVADWAARVRPMTPDLHGASVMATGAMYMIVGQAFVNLAVAAGIFPVTGVPLPLVSDGFSSMLSMSVAFALIHSALREVRRHLPDVQPEAVPTATD
ncbi:FtsW/RodA/SpoVE family cell cycle protein [Deinococcus maricopensis]|uniref:Cell cycle protein n=1 Tax=Deinococcus maricopensis (strain DSM 21211 / LMG 22137 / NRRL B-23946 / LB-34) TaxID=709986 RepID=E8U8B0_DEIML|nr:FtsW/RodA/SpoVE family cell cycle protein [Deinococcus maricopensis]ADV67299.1 cell cycle protein [Deinococcus maricopensis DSM 21211]